MQEGGTSAPASPSGSRPLRILVAEDNPINQKLISRILERSGHDAKIVENGAEAVASFSAERFDLVMLDLQMPVMDGISALKLIRSGARGGSNIPVMALTAHALNEQREEALREGFDSYVTKPIEREVLFREIERLTSPSLKSIMPDPLVPGT